MIVTCSYDRDVVWMAESSSVVENHVVIYRRKRTGNLFSSFPIGVCVCATEEQ